MHFRKHREEMQLFISEGLRLASEAKNVKYIIVSDKITLPDNLKNIPTYLANEKIFKSLTQTETPQGIIAVCQITQPNINMLKNALLICDRISDPGNLGTIIRTAECSGINGVVLSKGCADLYNAKTVRATMGAIFRLPIFTNVDLPKFISEHPEYRTIATTLSDAENLYNVDLSGKISIIIGNEANGISNEVLALCDKKVKIPMAGGESLNAAVAAGVVCFEWQRQILQN